MSCNMLNFVVKVHVVAQHAASIHTKESNKAERRRRRLGAGVLKAIDGQNW